VGSSRIREGRLRIRTGRRLWGGEDRGARSLRGSIARPCLPAQQLLDLLEQAAGLAGVGLAQLRLDLLALLGLEIELYGRADESGSSLLPRLRVRIDLPQEVGVHGDLYGACWHNGRVQ